LEGVLTGTDRGKLFSPEMKKGGMAAAREKAMREARGEVLGMMDRLAYHLAKVVGSWSAG
jgi:hypothetical protein